MQLRAPTACPKWNEGTDEDIKVLHWLSKQAGLTFECVSEVIKLFVRWRLENAIHGTTWNKAAKCGATRRVMFKSFLLVSRDLKVNLFGLQQDIHSDSVK